MKSKAWQSAIMLMAAIIVGITSCAAFSTPRLLLVSHRSNKHTSRLCRNQLPVHDHADFGSHDLHISQSTNDTRATPMSLLSASIFSFVLFLMAWLGPPLFQPPSNHYKHVDDASPHNMLTHINTYDARESFIQNLRPKQALAADSDALPRRKVYTLESRYLSRVGRLMDLSSILDEYTAKAILGEINAVEKETGKELQVVIVDRVSYNLLYADSSTMSERQYAEILFRGWHNGRLDNTSGVLILAVLQKQRVEIAITDDLRTYMTSQNCYLLTRESVPLFKEERYSEGIYNAVVGVANRLREIDSGVASKGGTEDISNALALMCLVGIPSFAAYAIVDNMRDLMYPIGEDHECSQCGGTKWTKVDTVWIKEPTYDTDGSKQIICKCSNCGYEDLTTRRVRRFGSDPGEI